MNNKYGRPTIGDIMDEAIGAICVGAFFIAMLIVGIDGILDGKYEAGIALTIIGGIFTFIVFTPAIESIREYFSKC